MQKPVYVCCRWFCFPNIKPLPETSKQVVLFEVMNLRFMEYPLELGQNILMCLS